MFFNYAKYLAQTLQRMPTPAVRGGRSPYLINEETEA